MGADACGTKLAGGCAGKMRIIFIVLCIVAGSFEVTIVLLIFRNAVNKLFERKQLDISRLSSIKEKVVIEKLNELVRKKKEARAAKRKAGQQNQGKVTKFAEKGKEVDSDDSLSSSDDSDVDDGNVQLSDDDDADDPSDADGVGNKDRPKTEHQQASDDRIFLSNNTGRTGRCCTPAL
jgi:hypothetical protein